MTPKTLDKYIAALKKKAAAGGWSMDLYQAELDKIKNEMAEQYLDDKITSEEYTKVSKQLKNAEKNPALQGKSSASSSGTSGMTKDEYTELVKALEKKNAAGLITDTEWATLADKLDKAYKDGKKVSEVENEIGCDPGTLATDQAIIDLGQEFKQIYGDASKEMQTKLNEFLKDYGPEMDDLNQKVLDGTITQDEYEHLKLMTIQKGVLNQKVDQLTGVMLNANQKAMGMINGEQLHVFAENANWQSYQLTQDTKMNLSFSIYDEDTAEKLIKDKPELLPRKEVNGKKDQAWNQKVIAGAVAQAVIQGDSIPKLARRIAVQTGETNMKAMTRYARTAMTSAQNSGRQEMLHRATGMGIKCKKVWLATLDSRTRDAHGKLDGQAVGVDEDFQSAFGPIKFPGDMSSKGSVPANLYNCRCTLIYDYEGFPNDPTLDQRISYDEYYTTEKDADGKEHKVFHRESSLITDMSYGEWKTAKEGSKLNELNAAKYQLAEAQKAVIKAKIKEDKVYEGLWKDPVTLKDYPAKKAGIQAKRDYYDTEIEKYKQAQAAGSSWATDDKIKELEKKKKLLNEFETRGELIEKRDNALQAVQDIYDQTGYQGTAAAPDLTEAKKKTKKTASAAGGTNTSTAGQTGAGLDLSTAGEKKTQFAPDAWDDNTKKDARSFSSRRSADQEIRPELDEDWDKLSDPEKYAVWEYTRNSNPMNKSLSGYHESWSRSNFIGLENTDWGHEDGYRTISTPAMRKFAKSDGHVGYKKAITDLTLGIEKTPLKKGMWLVRGSDENGLAGMMEGGGMSFSQVAGLFDGRHGIGEIKKALVGQVGRNHAFTSTGIASDAGFGGNIKYRIYAPKGTKCIYAEPQSYYGSTSSQKIYKKGQSYSSVGGEAEIIVQRGTVYRITDIKQSGRTYTVEMDIVEQPDYFVSGDEDTFNGGKTRHKR